MGLGGISHTKMDDTNNHKIYYFRKSILSSKDKINKLKDCSGRANILSDNDFVSFIINSEYFNKDNNSLYYFDKKRKIYPNILKLVLFNISLIDKRGSAEEKRKIMTSIYPFVHYYLGGNIDSDIKKGSKVYFLGRRNIYAKHINSVLKNKGATQTKDPKEADVIIVGDLVLREDLFKTFGKESDDISKYNEEDSENDYIKLLYNFTRKRNVYKIKSGYTDKNKYNNTSKYFYKENAPKINEKVLIFENDINNYYLNKLSGRSYSNKFNEDIILSFITKDSLKNAEDILKATVMLKYINGDIISDKLSWEFLFFYMKKVNFTRYPFDYSNPAHRDLMREFKRLVPSHLSTLLDSRVGNSGAYNYYIPSLVFNYLNFSGTYIEGFSKYSPSYMGSLIYGSYRSKVNIKRFHKYNSKIKFGEASTEFILNSVLNGLLSSSILKNTQNIPVITAGNFQRNVRSVLPGFNYIKESDRDFLINKYKYIGDSCIIESQSNIEKENILKDVDEEIDNKLKKINKNSSSTIHGIKESSKDTDSVFGYKIFYINKKFDIKSTFELVPENKNKNVLSLQLQSNSKIDKDLDNCYISNIDCFLWNRRNFSFSSRGFQKTPIHNDILSNIYNGDKNYKTIDEIVFSSFIFNLYLKNKKLDFNIILDDDKNVKSIFVDKISIMRYFVPLFNEHGLAGVTNNSRYSYSRNTGYPSVSFKDLIFYKLDNSEEISNMTGETELLNDKYINSILERVYEGDTKNNKFIGINFFPKGVIGKNINNLLNINNDVQNIVANNLVNTPIISALSDMFLEFIFRTNYNSSLNEDDASKDFPMLLDYKNNN